LGGITLLFLSEAGAFSSSFRPPLGDEKKKNKSPLRFKKKKKKRDTSLGWGAKLRARSKNWSFFDECQLLISTASFAREARASFF